MLGTFVSIKRPPRSDRVLRVSASGGAQQVSLAATTPIMSGIGIITLRAVAQDIQFYFDSVNTGSIALDSITANLMGTSIPVGQELTMEISGADLFLNYISRAAGGFLELWRSGQERIDQR